MWHGILFDPEIYRLIEDVKKWIYRRMAEE
jgi:hypothetical protein